jgi:NAD(P)-dependent dehydrogenase (short-subunit alcohol dehydrogenase family)
MRLQGKTALITGAGRGIGKATAALFCREGANVALLDRCQGPLAAALAEIKAAGGGAAISVVADVGRPEEASKSVSEAAAHFGRLDILINNAAISVARDVLELSCQEWESVLNANLTGQFLMAQAAASHMRNAEGGSIVNISSIQRRISEPGSAAYASSKGGVAQLTRSLAIELANFNIVVNSISPGFIGNTQLSLVDGVDETTTEKFQTFYINSGRIPLRRAGTVGDIAIAALFLASRECAYLTGADLVVDGGLGLTL